MFSISVSSSQKTALLHYEDEMPNVEIRNRLMDKCLMLKQLPFTENTVFGIRLYLHLRLHTVMLHDSVNKHTHRSSWW